MKKHSDTLPKMEADLHRKKNETNSDKKRLRQTQRKVQTYKDWKELRKTDRQKRLVSFISSLV